jgi:cell division protein FtsQ
MDYSDLPIGLSTARVDGLMQVSPNDNSFASLDTSDSQDLADASHIPDAAATTVETADAGNSASGEQESESVLPRTSFLRLVPNLERAAAPTASIPPTVTELNAQMVLGDSEVLSLFGEVSDAEFPEVSANHPARSLHPSAPRMVAGPQVVGDQLFQPPQFAQPAQFAQAGLVGTGQSVRPKRNLSALSSQPFNPETRVSVFAVDPDSQTLVSSNKQQAPARSRSYERRRPGSVGGVNTSTARITHPVFTTPASATTQQATAPLAGETVKLPATGVRTSTQTTSAQTTSAQTSSAQTSSAQTNQFGLAPSGHVIIDLREAEAGMPVVTRRRTDVNEVALTGADSYFDGHDYGRSRAVAPQPDRLSQRTNGINGTNRIHGADRNLAQPRLSLRTRALERTGLAPRVLTGLSLGAVGLLGIGLMFSPVFALHRIDIRRAGTAEPRIRSAAKLRAGAPLVSLDIEAIQRRIAALPEVSAAKVERKWPRGLRITVATRTPVVALSHAGRIALVASDGTVLRDFGPGVDVVDDDGMAYRPIVTDVIVPVGETVTGASKRVSDLFSALDSDLRDRVVSVTVNGDDLNASLSAAGKVGYLSVRFGDEHELAIKAHALGALLAAGSAANVAGIDLTVPDAPVLRLSSSKG